MKTVKQLIEELKQFPLDAKCYAYEGEVTGLVIVTDPTAYINAEDAFISCSIRCKSEMA